MIHIIYLLENKINKKVYVGQTTWTLDKRFKRHCTLAKSGKQTRLCAAIRKYGPDGFNQSVIKTAKSQKESDRLECFYIKKFDSLNKDKGYNMVEGGTGGRQSAEIYKRIADQRRGTHLSEETKRKISISNKGKLKGDKNPAKRPEVRERIRNTLLRLGTKPPIVKVYGPNHHRWGKRHTKEVKKLLSISSSRTYEDRMGLVNANLCKEKLRKRWTGNKNPNWKTIDIKSILKDLRKGMYTQDIQRKYKICWVTIKKKIEIYFDKKFTMDEIRNLYL